MSDYINKPGLTPAEDQAARAAVLAINLFPDLERMLIAALGPGPEAIMEHQLSYWFSRPNMAGRWWLYKTFTEWRDERGLSRRAVERGRDELVKKGLIEWAHGPYKRIHYRINWPKLAATLNLNPIARPESAPNGIDTPETPEIPRTIGDCTPENGHDPHSHAGDPPETGEHSRLHAPDEGNPAYLRGEPPKSRVHSNTGDSPQEYEHEIAVYNSPRPAFEAAAGRESLEDFLPKQLDDYAPMPNLADATNGRKTEALDPLKANRAYMLMDDDGSKAGRLLRARADNAKVAEELAATLEGDESKAAMYIGAVEGFLKMAPELTRKAV